MEADSSTTATTTLTPQEQVVKICGEILDNCNSLVDDVKLVTKKLTKQLKNQNNNNKKQRLKSKS